MSEGYRVEFHNGNMEGHILKDEDCAKQALDRTTKKYQRRLTEREVVNVVCGVYGIPKEELALKMRTRKDSEAWAMAALFVSKHDELSLVFLGRIFNRDISGLSQAARRLWIRWQRGQTSCPNLRKGVLRVKRIPISPA